MARATQIIDATRSAAPSIHRAGFTLIEAMIASTIVAVAVVGVAGLMAASSAQSMYSRETSIAVLLGRQLMEEIASKPLLDPTDGSRTLGPESGETSRTLYDNVDDYNDYFDKSDAIKTASGDWYALGDGQIYQRKVWVEYRATPSGALDPAGNFAMVTVVVSTPSGQTIRLYRLMTNTTLSP
jgi:prepilin-type N-terminal cleavage/methylation domain-containing protein